MARLVVLADSLAFHGPHGPLPLVDPRLYPNLLAGRLAAADGRPWTATVVGRAGWSLRDVWLALCKDVHLQQQVLPGADAIVLAVGSSDPLPVGIPRLATVALPFLRPPWLRRGARRTLRAVHPGLVRLTGGRMTYTPWSVYADAWRRSVEVLALYARQGAGDGRLCAVLPATHTGPYYAAANPHRERYAAGTRLLAAQAGVGLADLDACVRPALHRLNADGLHWPFDVHERVAVALAAALGVPAGVTDPAAGPAAP